MNASWQVTVNGHEHTVSVEKADTGKDVVRVDGKAAARPLNPEETQRSFFIEEYPYVVHRDGDEFLLFEDNAPPRGFTAAPVRKGFAGLSPAARNTISAVLVIGAVAALIWTGANQRYERAATRRVESLMTAMRNGDDEVTAIMLWSPDAARLSGSELLTLRRNFHRWRREGQVERVSSFSIVDATRTSGDSRTFIVTVQVNGRDHKLRVPEAGSITWAD